jgi:predicted molibdopterin-dependent oxidoreductase YjgC
VLAEIASAIPIYRGLTYARLGFQGVQWPRQGAGGSESLFGAADLTFSPAPVTMSGTPAGSGAR